MKAGNKYLVQSRCKNCGVLYNQTKAVSKEMAEKIYNGSLANPLISWCDDCDRLPELEIVRLKEGWK